MGPGLFKKRAVGYAIDYGCRVTVGAEDASRSDFSFLVEFGLVAQESGAVRLRYADTLGVLDPFTAYEQIVRLRKSLEVELEFHGHNDFGMATANALAAAAAGTRYIDTTIGGLGERAGNTCLEQFNQALKSLYQVDLKLNGKTLAALSRYVARACGLYSNP